MCDCKLSDEEFRAYVCWLFSTLELMEFSAWRNEILSELPFLPPQPEPLEEKRDVATKVRIVLPDADWREIA